MQRVEWPGKSPIVPGGMEHPAAFHMLDVAAVAERLIVPFPIAAPLRDALVALAGPHDIGKISPSLRAMLREGVSQPGFSHWALSEALFYVEDARIASRLGGTSYVRNMLYAASAGHHGRPPDSVFGGLPTVFPAHAGMSWLWPGLWLLPWDGKMRPGQAAKHGGRAFCSAAHWASFRLRGWRSVGPGLARGSASARGPVPPARRDRSEARPSAGKTGQTTSRTERPQQPRPA